MAVAAASDSECIRACGSVGVAVGAVLNPMTFWWGGTSAGQRCSQVGVGHEYDRGRDYGRAPRPQPMTERYIQAEWAEALGNVPPFDSLCSCAQPAPHPSPLVAWLCPCHLLIRRPSNREVSLTGSAQYPALLRASPSYGCRSNWCAEGCSGCCRESRLSRRSSCPAHCQQRPMRRGHTGPGSVNKIWDTERMNAI